VYSHLIKVNKWLHHYSLKFKNWFKKF
jgi:hypothetical protein